MREVAVWRNGQKVIGEIVCSPSSESGECAIKINDNGKKVFLCRHYTEVAPLDDEAVAVLSRRRKPTITRAKS